MASGSAPPAAGCSSDESDPSAEPDASGASVPGVVSEMPAVPSASSSPPQAASGGGCAGHQPESGPAGQDPREHLGDGLAVGFFDVSFHGGASPVMP